MNMKKLLILLGIGALLFALPAWGEGDFELDEQRVYSGMGRSYLQGYAPTVKGNELTVILPSRPKSCPMTWPTVPSSPRPSKRA